MALSTLSYKDTSFLDWLYEHKYAATHQSKNVVFSIKFALETAWDGRRTAFTTIKEVLQLAAPKGTPVEVLKTLLGKETMAIEDC